MIVESVIHRLLVESLKEHFDTSKFPKLIAKPEAGREIYSYDGKEIEISDHPYNEKWLRGTSSIYGNDNVASESKESILADFKRQIDLSKMPKEVQNAFEYVEYVSMAGPDEWPPTRKWLARLIEEEKNGHIEDEMPGSYQAFHNLPLEIRMKIIDEVVDSMINSVF